MGVCKEASLSTMFSLWGNFPAGLLPSQGQGLPHWHRKTYCLLFWDVQVISLWLPLCLATRILKAALKSSAHFHSMPKQRKGLWYLSAQKSFSVCCSVGAKIRQKIYWKKKKKTLHWLKVQLFCRLFLLEICSLPRYYNFDYLLETIFFLP